MKTIYTLTLNPALDKSTAVDQVIPENKLRCAPPRYDPGGGGINVSRAIKKLGGSSTAIYLKGGPSGDIFKDLLDKEGILQQPIESTTWTRENFIVVETLSNRQFRFGMPGGLVNESEWNSCLEYLSKNKGGMDYLVVSGSNPPGLPDTFFSTLAGMAREKGVKLVLDTSGAPLKAAMKHGIYLLKPNLKELSDLVGRDLATISDQEDAAMEIIDQGKIELLAVSLGASGALIASKNGVSHVPAPPAVKKSTVGAGDSMVGGMVLSLSLGRSIIEALKYGIAAGTAATMNAGTELCKLQDVEVLYKWINANQEKIVTHVH